MIVCRAAGRRKGTCSLFNNSKRLCFWFYFLVSFNTDRHFLYVYHWWRWIWPSIFCHELSINTTCSHNYKHICLCFWWKLIVFLINMVREFLKRVSLWLKTIFVTQAAIGVITGNYAPPDTKYFWNSKVFPKILNKNICDFWPQCNTLTDTSRYICTRKITFLIWTYFTTKISSESKFLCISKST